MSGDLGIALVGCGDVGRRNAEAVAAARGARLARVADADAGAAARLADAMGVPACASLAEALDDPGVGAVFVSTPHDLHAPMILEAAGRGRHVIVEKPLATTVAAAREAVLACERAGVLLSPCHPRRYEAKVAFARRLVEEGLLGGVRLTATRFVKEKTADYWRAAPWRASRERSGGGLLLMNLVHHLDALQQIVGCKVVAADARCATLRAEAEVEDTVVATVRFASGALGTLTACAALPGPKVFEDAVWGDAGRLVVDKRSVRLWTGRDNPHAPPGSWAEFPFAEDGGKTRFVEEFAGAVREGREPPVRADYGLDLLALILDAYREGEPVTREVAP